MVYRATPHSTEPIERVELCCFLCRLISCCTATNDNNNRYWQIHTKYAPEIHYCSTNAFDGNFGFCTNAPEICQLAWISERKKILRINWLAIATSQCVCVNVCRQPQRIVHFNNFDLLDSFIQLKTKWNACGEQQQYALNQTWLK